MGYVISRQGIEGLGSTFGSILPSISYESVGGHACGRPGESLAPSLRVDFYCCITFKIRLHLDLPLVANVEPLIEADFTASELTHTDFDFLHAGLALTGMYI